MDKKKLNAKDFINIGIFTVIYFVMFFITGIYLREARPEKDPLVHRKFQKLLLPGPLRGTRSTPIG